MPITRMRNWNKPLLAAAMAIGWLCAPAASAQQTKPVAAPTGNPMAPASKASPADTAPAPVASKASAAKGSAQVPARGVIQTPTQTPSASEPGGAATSPAVVNDDTGDALIDALTCRSDNVALPGLLARLRRERPDDFTQTDRQYSQPPMDLYRLEYPVQAWGHVSDAVVITENRVLMVVPGPVDAATKRLEERLADSAAQPLSGALDDQHALVLYEEERPGLQQQVLIGCEYRLQGLSLLDNPEDLWRVPPPPVASPASSNVAVP